MPFYVRSGWVVERKTEIRISSDGCVGIRSSSQPTGLFGRRAESARLGVQALPAGGHPLEPGSIAMANLVPVLLSGLEQRRMADGSREHLGQGMAEGG